MPNTKNFLHIEFPFHYNVFQGDFQPLLPLDFFLKFRYDRRISFKCREKEEYISHLKRERDPPAERFREGLLMEGSFGAVFLNRRTEVLEASGGE